MIETGSDFSGVGAFDQALIKLGINYKTVFACDMDKYARQTYIENYGEPEYYPENVYNRVIPEKSLDIYMTSPPCQAFSLAGKRKGEDDKRGVLFYNSLEFIKKNNPRYFIFENVKGLLSDDSGKTFQKWIDLLAGKSVNGNTVIFPNDDSVPYHVYYQVLNAKDYGVPQNRERIFIIGIRDDTDNNFSFPKPFHLVKRLKDVLESEVDEKYFLSDKMIKGLLREGSIREGQFQPHNENDVSKCLTARYFKQSSSDPYLKVKSATSQGYEVDPLIGAIRGRNPENPLSRESGLPTEQRLELNINGTSNALTTVKKDNVVIQINPSKESVGKQPYQQNRIYDSNGISTTLCRDKSDINVTTQDYRIRRLTVREAFRLMDFPDSFTWSVSDTQAYKQAGNSIVVNVLAQIIKKLNLTI